MSHLTRIQWYHFCMGANGTWDRIRPGIAFLQIPFTEVASLDIGDFHRKVQIFSAQCMDVGASAEEFYFRK
jgi:alpha-D-ribose 1-methylphosphonate 5-phosphate C-P lyase